MINIRQALPTDIKQVAVIHKQQFSDHYLGSFSVYLLERFYKSFFCIDNIFFVYEENGRILGFVLGGELSKINVATSQFIYKNIPLYIGEIFLRPKIWLKSLKKLYGILFNRNVSKDSLDAYMNYTLLSIAVSPEVQGKGVASHLVKSFDSVMKQYSRHYFLSVHKENERAIKFYLNMGFLIERSSEKEVQLIKTIL